MASRHCALVGVLVLMFFCLGSAHRLFLETRGGSMALSGGPIKESQPTHDSNYESTHGLFAKPANEPMDVDHIVYEPFKNSACEKLGPIQFAEEPTTKPWDLDRPAEKETHDAWFAASLNKYGPASPKAYWAGLREVPISEFEENQSGPPLVDWATLKEGPSID